MTLVMSMVLLVLAACSSQPKGPAAPKLTDEQAIDLLWKYEQAVAFKLSDPNLYVTGTEKKWLDQYLADREAKKPAYLDWTTNNAVIQIAKQDNKETIASSTFSSQGTQYTVQFKLVPVEGAWKIENHQTLEGKWWAPAK